MWRRDRPEKRGTRDNRSARFRVVDPRRPCRDGRTPVNASMNAVCLVIVVPLRFAPELTPSRAGAEAVSRGAGRRPGDRLRRTILRPYVAGGARVSRRAQRAQPLRPAALLRPALRLRPAG